MNSADEAHFRVQAPNSLPRATAVIALDADAQAVIERLGRTGRPQATLLSATSPDGLLDLAGRARNLREEVDRADLVVLVAGPGGRAHAAPAIGEACSRRRVMTTGFVVAATAAPEREVSQTLAQLRPWSLMVVIAGDDSYIDDMLTALRA